MNEWIDIDYSAVQSLPELVALLRRKHVSKNRYWHYIEAYQERKAGERGIPISGQFEITPLCNLDCRMCNVHLNPDQLKGASLLPTDWWKDIMTQAHAQGMMNAALTGGECLTYPGFDDLYLFLRSLGIKVSVKTNGLLLTEERVEFFRKYQPCSITVSLYGSSDEAYTRVTGHAVFDTVYENLLRLKDAGLPVMIAVTPSRYLYEDLENIFRLIDRLHIPFLFNVALFQPRRETGRALCDITQEEYVEIYKMLRKQAPDRPLPAGEAEPPACGGGSTPEYGIRCSAGRSSFTISWNGQMAACDNLNSLRVSLLDHSLSDAWKKIHADALAFPLPVECADCAYDRICFNCSAYRSNGAEKGHCNPEICTRTKLLVKEGILKMNG